MPKVGLTTALILSEHLPYAEITPLNYCTSAKGIFDDTTPLQLHQAIVEYSKVCDRKSFALFFHGGLVRKGLGMDAARQLYVPYSAADSPDGLAGNAYPYFFVWESGLMETLSHNLPGIVAETIFQRIRDIVGDKAWRLLGGAPKPLAQIAAQRSPFLYAQIESAPRRIEVTPSDLEEVRQAVDNDPLIKAAKLRIAMSARPTEISPRTSTALGPRAEFTSQATYLSPDFVAAIADEETHRFAAGAEVKTIDKPRVSSLALAAGEVLERIIQRYASGRNHNFHNTLVEEIFRKYYVSNIGWAVWNEMKDETAEAFEGIASTHVGAAMISELVALYESGKRGRRARITLLGHSTGAVYICNFLAAMSQALAGKPYSKEIKFDVIFMAPAVRVDQFSQTLQNFGGLIRNFRAFEMADALESQEILLQFDGTGSVANPILAQVYTSSLLYFISGCLEDNDDDTPIDGMDRFFQGTPPFSPGQFPAIDAVRRFHDGQRVAVVRSDTSNANPQPALGERCTSRHHGGFPVDDKPAADGVPHIGGTLESVCYLLRTGKY